jgi:hypothetical protein
MKFANLNPPQRIVEREQLPRFVEFNGQLTTTPTPEDYAAIGWRRVVNEQTPADGVVVTGWTITETGPLTCNLTIATTTTQAALDAARIVQEKADARALLGQTDGLARLILTVVGQLVLLINTERGQHGRAAITQQQIVTTLRSALE